MSYTEYGFAEAAQLLAEANGVSLDMALSAMVDIGDTPVTDESGRVIWTDPETGITHFFIFPEEE